MVLVSYFGDKGNLSEWEEVLVCNLFLNFPWWKEEEKGQNKRLK